MSRGASRQMQHGSSSVGASRRAAAAALLSSRSLSLRTISSSRETRSRFADDCPGSVRRRPTPQLLSSLAAPARGASFAEREVRRCGGVGLAAASDRARRACRRADTASASVSVDGGGNGGRRPAPSSRRRDGALAITMPRLSTRKPKRAPHSPQRLPKRVTQAAQNQCPHDASTATGRPHRHSSARVSESSESVCESCRSLPRAAGGLPPSSVPCPLQLHVTYDAMPPPRVRRPKTRTPALSWSSRFAHSQSGMKNPSGMRKMSHREALQWSTASSPPPEHAATKGRETQQKQAHSSGTPSAAHNKYTPRDVGRLRSTNGASPWNVLMS
mmetsp:Transcript_11802/g.41320  ORF Transcript_11802/g.41320 Transcript_11802/m.41320 type:complete len:330 (+) Transcript_11802:262-1251(+)